MSTALAIASVTAVLKDLLNNGLIDHDLTSQVGDVTVSALPPDRIEVGSQEESRLNLFLYQVTPNSGWRNVNLPSTDAAGRRLSNPPLALDLHYLLSAYGRDEFHGEILLGYGMQLMHETPVLSRDAVRTTLSPPTPVSGGGGLPAAMRNLFTSELAEQVELIKITPETLTTEEMSRMWSAFQAKFRPSAAYHASVVLIQSRRTTRAALPVRERLLYAIPFRQPVIRRVGSRATPADPDAFDRPILSSHDLVLEGERLTAESMEVRVGGSAAAWETTSADQRRLVVHLPAGLGAGIQGVQVLHHRLMGSPPAPHRGVASEVAAFVLRPRLTSAPTASAVTAEGAGRFSADIALDVDPPVAHGDDVVLKLNALPSSPLTGPLPSYSVPVAPADLPGPGDPARGSLTIPVSGIEAATYLVRLQVSGAESPLGPETGPFTTPSLAIP